MDELRDLAFRAQASGIVELKSDIEESASGHVDTTTSEYACRIDDQPVVIEVVWTTSYLKLRERKFKIISRRPITEGEYRSLTVGKKLVDSPDALAKVRHEDNLRKRVDTLTPRCPKCSNKMVERSSKYGHFWGCPKFPKCDGKREVSPEYLRLTGQ